MSVKIEALDVHEPHGARSRADPLKGSGAIQGKANIMVEVLGVKFPEAVRFYIIFKAKSLPEFVHYYENVRPN